MIDVSRTTTPGLLEVRMTGEITSKDYDETLTPAIEKALKQTDHLRMLAIVDKDFEKFDLGAAWADAKLGLTHWRGFDRVALVTDTGWIATSARVFGVMAPCPVQVFTLAEVEEARRWLRESLGAVHIRELGGDAIEIQLLGELEPEAIDQARGDLEAKVRGKDSFRLLLDLREFSGWEGISAFGNHLGLIRENAPIVQKVAILGDSAWQEMAQKVMGRFLNRETRYFSEDEADAARDWLSAD